MSYRLDSLSLGAQDWLSFYGHLAAKGPGIRQIAHGSEALSSACNKKHGFLLQRIVTATHKGFPLGGPYAHPRG